MGKTSSLSKEMGFPEGQVILLGFTFKPVEDSNHFEIHTELFVHGNIFTFSGKPEDPGICAREVTPGWLHQITNGQFGKKTKFSSGGAPEFDASAYAQSFDKYWRTSLI